MAKNWRDDVTKALDSTEEAAACGSSWIDLLVAEKKLEVAKEAIGSALKRLAAIPTVIAAKKSVQLTGTP